MYGRFALLDHSLLPVFITDKNLFEGLWKVINKKVKSLLFAPLWCEELLVQFR